jgi:gliding motility-associated-like protein
VLDEGTEYATIEIHGGCSNTFLADVQLEIVDAIPFSIQDIEICPLEEGQFNPSGNSVIDSIIWSPADNLSCVSCVSPFVTPVVTTGYLASYIDRATGCAAQDSAFVFVDSVESAFDFHYDDHYTTLDLFFDNHSVNAVTFDWSFGDGNTSTEFEPLHTYDFTEENESLTYEIELISTSSAGCKDTSTNILIITDPLYIPNVFTPTGDLENNVFEVLGIQRGVWTLKVYNRWGKKVYESENYNNDWDGEGLSDGVYYWYLENPVGDRAYKGWVVITRG